MNAGVGARNARQRRGGDVRDTIREFAEQHRSTSIIVAMAVIAAVLPVLAAVPPFSLFQPHNAWVDGFANAGTYVLLAVGLNIVVGLAGLLDLGYAAFFAFGAYAYAYGASPFSHNDLPFLPLLLVGAAVAATFGVILGAPTLRLHLAIVTFGFGEIVPIVFLNAEQYTNGTNGIGGVYQPTIPLLDRLPDSFQFSFTNPWPFYVLMIFILTIVMIFAYRLQDSRLGRAWMAIREDELAAASSGVNTVTTKLLAFALGASTAGLAGVFNAAKLTVVSPDQFLFAVSFTVLAMIVLGGMGNIWGVAVGAFVISTIQQTLLKQLDIVFHQLGIPILKDVNFLSYQFLLYGVALVLMMLLRPEGLFPSGRRRRELHSAEDSAGEALVVDPAAPTGGLV
ncbi:MAG: branched-chain amino acid ABC transporter permease [Chloroflexi bacterium]|nr:MAG: branched-chain amino acid ABC transporter permease [Chloroflexota bacterium]